MICWYNGQNDFNDSGYKRSAAAHTMSAEGSSSYILVKLPESGLDFPTVSNRETRIGMVAYVDSRQKWFTDPENCNELFCQAREEREKELDRN